MFEFWKHAAEARKRREAAVAPGAFASAWLSWLHALQTYMSRTSFPEDPDLSGLRAMWEAGASVEDGRRWIEEGAPRA